MMFFPDFLAFACNLHMILYNKMFFLAIFLAHMLIHNKKIYDSVISYIRIISSSLEPNKPVVRMLTDTRSGKGILLPVPGPVGYFMFGRVTGDRITGCPLH